MAADMALLPAVLHQLTHHCIIEFHSMAAFLAPSFFSFVFFT